MTSWNCQNYSPVNQNDTEEGSSIQRCEIIASFLIQENDSEPFENSYFPCKLYDRGEIVYSAVICIQKVATFEHVGPSIQS